MNDFGAALREWRTRRRLSQLELALRTGTTQRHVSFLESGRSAPGRGMVVRFAESPQLPPRERNAPLLTAGYAPSYPETRLDDPALRPVLAGLRRLLDGHRPYPAVVVDRFGELVAANDALPVLTEGAAPELLEPPVPLRLRWRSGELRLITAITTFATAVDVAVSELRLETFLPADHTTAEALARAD